MTETTTEAAAVVNDRCAACGQEDDHPMIHVWGVWQKPTDDGLLTVVNPSFHFDCLPDDAHDLWGIDRDAPEHANLKATQEAARAGTHGDDLRAFIAGLPSDNDVDTTPEA